jgi:DNA-directed RNA polymerase I and III subunit RPAC2
VEFCGYSVPHPSEAKILLRIQSRGLPAVDILKAALDELQRVCSVFLNKFEAAVDADDYEVDLGKEI